MLKKLLLLAIGCSVSPLVRARTLHVYGPGSPAGPMKECAAAFIKRAVFRSAAWSRRVFTNYPAA